MGIGGADNRNSFCRRNIYVGSHLRHDGNSPKRKGGALGHWDGGGDVEIVFGGGE